MSESRAAEDGAAGSAEEEAAGSAPPSWRVPRSVLTLSLLVTFALLAPIAVGLAVGGIAAALGLAMGYTASAIPAMKVPARHALLLALPAALTGVVAVGVNGEALPAAAFMALACLLVAPANVHDNGLLSGIPTVAAIFVVIPAAPAPAPVGGWMLVGSAIIVAVLTRLRQDAPRDEVPERAAWLQAAAMAAATALVVYLLTLHEVPHGYWIVMTLTILLRPYAHETTNKARQRVVGTIVGAIGALVLAVLLPPAAAFGIATLLFVLLIAYTVTDNYALAIACATPFIVLLGAGGGLDSTVEVIVQRVLATIAGALIAGVIALAVARQTRSWEARALPPGGQ